MSNSLHSQNLVMNGRGNGQGTMRGPSIFATLPADVQEKLKAGAVRRFFRDGQIVAQRGDIPDGFWVIEKGQAKIGNYDAEGEMQTLFIAGPGSSFGELACLGEFSRVVDVEAISDLEALYIGDRQFRAALDASPLAARSLLRSLAGQLQDAVNGLFEMRNAPAPKRMVRRLLIMCGSMQAPVRLSIRQQELAELVGVSRMTVGTALTKLESKGLISRQYGHIIVEDVDGLRDWLRA